ncbi:hypothetical protein [Amycolatopsis sp. NBC_00438]|uniref:hypothetical protein n=1 Tax=Amycolatopsis sp. NBC_00438 TaxID=2903558 RepID=UPI002E1D6873
MTARQHQSHQNLLAHIDAGVAPRAALDAIIVPNGRTAPYLRQAIAAAKERDVFLLVLCSLLGDASKAVKEAKRAGVRAAAINIREVPHHLVPTFHADNLLYHRGFDRKVDTSLKRNLGLLIAVLAGWERILFLDDDITLPDPGDLSVAARLLSEYAAVGLGNAGMPDNSVVCHALRDTGVAQATFIGGGALAVGEAAFGSFFPNVYNEDWFFLLDGMRLRPSAVTGTAIQHPYDPYRDARRARGEELGDTLAEGVYGLLDNGHGPADADERYWREFLLNRQEIIRTTIANAQALPIEPALKARMVASLKAAIGRSYLITPELCVRYLRAWRRDCERWGNHVQDLRSDHESCGVDGALAMLGIGQFAQRSLGSAVNAGVKRRSSASPSSARA